MGFEVSWADGEREDFDSVAAAESEIRNRYKDSLALAEAQGVYVAGPFLRFPHFTTFADFDRVVRAAAAAAAASTTRGCISGVVYIWRRHGLTKAAAAMLPFVASAGAVRIADPQNSPTAVQATLARAAGAMWGPDEDSDADLAGTDSRPCAFALALPWLPPPPAPPAGATKRKRCS